MKKIAVLIGGRPLIINFFIGSGVGSIEKITLRNLARLMVTLKNGYCVLQLEKN